MIDKFVALGIGMAIWSTVALIWVLLVGAVLGGLK